MSVLYNFGAGPACLPPEVLNQIRDDIPDWHEGMSIMEISHRLPIAIELTQKIEADLRQLLSIPENFVVLFMPGGARTQFSAIALNLLGEAKSADYLITGLWSKLAFEDAKRYCQANCVASSEKMFSFIPPQEQWQIKEDSAYFHYADNETVHGVEFSSTPNIENKWLVCDMTSSILTKPLEIDRFGVIYASAQKNLGIAGITLVIVRKTLLNKAHPFTPPTLNYTTCAKMDSMLNTPPLFCWYVCGLIIKWALSQGGVAALSTASLKKAELFYNLIDSSQFYTSPVQKAYRSRITIPFYLPTLELEKMFLQKANEAKLKQLKGHKEVGGCRACFYIGMPLAGVQVLVEFMKEFERRYG